MAVKLTRMKCGVNKDKRTLCSQQLMGHQLGQEYVAVFVNYSVIKKLQPSHFSKKP